MKISDNLRSQVKTDSLVRLRNQKIDKTANLHLYNEVLEVGQKLKAGPLETNIERRSAFVFVDLMPNYNWAHPCQILLYDAENGKQYKTIDARFPPSLIEREPTKVEAFHTPVKFIDTRKERLQRKKGIPSLTNALSNAKGTRYAILFSGNSNNRHLNDLEFLYRTLIDVYGFDSANIYTLNHDGTANYNGLPKPVGNWPGDNTPYRLVGHIDGQGTQATMESTIDTIATKIKSSDFLFIHTNDHGAGPGDGVNDFCLCAYNPSGGWSPYFVNSFVTKLSSLPQFDVLMIMMEQCRSGGFVNPIINNSPAKWTHIATAVRAQDYSLGGTDFDPFAEDWIAGITGHYSDGTGLTQTVDTNNDGRLSATEAYDYANAVHHQGDTPTVADKPGGYGAYIYLGLPAHDLFLRDNLEDNGLEPLIGGGISCSPDIIVYNQELLDPDTTLASPPSQEDDTLGETVEYGQDNFIYLRVQNRGAQPTSGKARVFWSPGSTLPTPASWKQIGNDINIPSVNPGEFKVVGPLKWAKNDIPNVGHYCFIGLIDSGDDPAPDKNAIQSIDDYYHFIRESNNATWKNFNVVNMFADSVTNLSFHIQGWPRKKLSTDLMIDLTTLPTNVKVFLRILKRLSSGAVLENVSLIEEKNLYQKFSVKSAKKAFLRNMNLKASDDSEASLQFVVPEKISDGSYRVSVAQIVDGLEMGRVTQMLSVGKYPYVANMRSKEVHVPNCDWATKMSPRNKLAYTDLDRALKHGYNGCRYCLKEYSTD